MAGFEFLSAFNSPYAGRDFASQIDRKNAELVSQVQLAERKRLLSAGLDKVEADALSAQKAYDVASKLEEEKQMLSQPSAQPSAPVAPSAAPVPSGTTGPLALPKLGPAQIQLPPQTPMGNAQMLSSVPTMQEGTSKTISSGQSGGASSSSSAGAGTPEGKAILDQLISRLNRPPKEDVYSREKARGLETLALQNTLNPNLGLRSPENLLSEPIGSSRASAAASAKAINDFNTKALQEASDLVQRQTMSESQKYSADTRAQSAKDATDVRKLSAELKASGDKDKISVKLLEILAKDAQATNRNLTQMAAIRAQFTSSPIVAALLGEKGLANFTKSLWNTESFLRDRGNGQGAMIRSIALAAGANNPEEMTRLVNAWSEFDLKHKPAEVIEETSFIAEQTKKVREFLFGTPPDIEKANEAIDRANLYLPDGSKIAKIELGTLRLNGSSSGKREKKTAKSAGPARPKENPNKDLSF